MKNKTPFSRVGTSYYKKVKKPLISDDVVETIVLWKKDAIIDDYGKKYLEHVPKYDGFCNNPSHTNHQEKIENFMNMYEKLNHTPKEGRIENFKQFMQHIFQDHHEIGLDYLTILYQKPIQLLPVLCLVSKERGTGKTTFLNLLKAIFGKNMTYNKNEDFRSQFNSDWASKLLIAVDEVLLDRREDSERIKNLSTARTFKSEAKGKDRVEVEFFGKFILCSNNENDFIQIEPGEIRYWVIKVNPIENDDVFLLEKLKAEIPAIMHFLAHKEITTQNLSRMWFHPSILKTKALSRVINRNKSKIEMELASIFNDILYDFDREEIKFTLTDATALLGRSKVGNYNRTQVSDILQKIWGLSPINNSGNYTRYCINSAGHIYDEPKQAGRYYTVNRQFIDDKLLNC
jgi:hypothetical protein